MAAPLLIPMFVGALVSAAGSMAGRVLIALGVGYVSYQGIDLMLSGLKSLTISNFSGIPSDIAGVMSALKVGVAINITFSAIAAKFAIAGVKGGALKKMALK